MPPEGPEDVASLGIPHGRSVIASGEDMLAVSAQSCNNANLLSNVVTDLHLDSLQGLAGVDFPDDCGFVPRPSDDTLAVGAQRHGCDRRCVPLESLEGVTSVGIPEDCGFVPRPSEDTLA